jgi:mono/diheme cytochrome c family protein
MRCLAAIGCLAFAAGLAAIPATGTDEGEKSPTYRVSGSYTFRTYCASCHGENGKGDGPLAENLRFHPPDLTRIAKRTGGEFPAKKVTQIVDGREPLEGHGGPDMPVWGDAFKNAETGFDDERVKLKIRAVVDHLAKLQEK